VLDETVVHVTKATNDKELHVLAEANARKKVVLTNFSEKTAFTYVTVRVRCSAGRLGVRNPDGEALADGKAMNDDGVEYRCVTFCVTAPPMTSMYAFEIDTIVAPQATSLYFMGWAELERPVSCSEPVAAIRFPLSAGRRNAKKRRDEEPSWLCTQGIGGPVTHFFRESFYAIDLQCEKGTAVVAAGDGVITEVCNDARCCGCDAKFLSNWTSVALRLDKPAGLVVEYLHIGQNVPVDVGERVCEGQVIAFSSDQGFAPEPHLHVEAHMETDDASLMIAFKGKEQAFLPVAGVSYNENGACEKSK